MRRCRPVSSRPIAGPARSWSATRAFGAGIRRHDLNAAGVEIQDLDDASADGTITVPADGTQVLLEHNIVVSFSVEPTTGEFRSGDYWVFAARARRRLRRGAGRRRRRAASTITTPSSRW